MDRSRKIAGAYPRQLREQVAELLPHRGLALIESGRRWCDRMLVLGAVMMCWSSGASLGARFAEAREAVAGMYPSRRRPGRSLGGFWAMLRRHHARLVTLVMGSLRSAMIERCGRRWLIEGRCVFGVDGTKIDVPRTKANEAALGCCGREGSGPQMLLVTLMHLATRMPWAMAQAAGGGDERGLLIEMLGPLPAMSVVVADAGFVGWRTMKAVMRAGHTLIVRAGANVRLLEELGWSVDERGGDIVYLWPVERREAGDEPMVVRRVRVRDGRNRVMCLLCTELDAKTLGDAAIARLYAMRWGLEVGHRWLKQTLGRRKMLSATPGNAAMELAWTVIGAWVLGLLMLPGAAGTLSYAKALTAVRAAMRGDLRPGRLRRQLLHARGDTYTRRGPKQTRHWPRKARSHTCGLPKARMATALEIQCARQLRQLHPAA